MRCRVIVRGDAVGAFGHDLAILDHHGPKRAAPCAHVADRESDRASHEVTGTVWIFSGHDC